MEVIATEKERQLTLALRGELDHHGAKECLSGLDRALDLHLPRRLTLDFSGVSFMDSSGIAVVMRAVRHMAALGGSVELCSVPQQAKKVFQAAGVTRLVTIQ